MPDEHPNIRKRDWRLRAITTTAAPFLSPAGKTYPAGTPVCWIGVAQLSDGSNMPIPVPDPTAMYLSLARKSSAAASVYINSLLTRGLDQSNGARVALDDESEPALFDCLESMVACIVFSFSAIEAFTNSTIPDRHAYIVERQDKKCTERYDKAQIERNINLDVKLDVILPSICGVASPKGTKLWQDYVTLKKTRDRLIHLKSSDWMESSLANAKDYVWTWVLANEAINAPASAFELIWYYLPDEKPRWAGKLRDMLSRAAAGG